MISLIERHLRSFLATVEVPYPMNAVFHAGAFHPHAHDNNLPFVTLAHVL